MNVVEYARLKKVLGPTAVGTTKYYGTEGLAYTLSSNSRYYICSGIGTATDTDIVIGLSYMGLPVREIGAEAFEGNTRIKHVIIPDSVIVIGYDAFSGCAALEEIIIPNSVREIGWYAFNGCTALTSATIGHGVSYLSDYVFKGCRNLKTITFESNGINLTYMGQGLFNGCRSLDPFVVPLGVTKLLMGTLSANGGTTGGVTYQGVKSITIPAHVTTLASKAIYSCVNLESVVFEGTPDAIGTGMFSGCSKLRHILVPWSKGTFADVEAEWEALGATINYL